MKQNYSLAVVFSLLGNFQIGVINVIISKMPYELHALRIFFFQLLFSLLIFSFYGFRNGLSVFKTSQIKLHAMRGVIAIFTIFFFYASLRLISPLDATLLKCTAPLFVPLLSILWLKEKVPLITWPLIFVGFFGVYLVIGPINSEFSMTHFFPLLAAVGVAYLVVCLKKLVETESTEQVLLYFFLIGLICTAPIVLWNWQPMPWELWGILLILGSVYAFSQFCFVMAYSYTMPGKLSPFIFGEVFFTYLLIEIFFGISLSMREIAGAALIFGSAFMMFLAMTRAKQTPTVESPFPIDLDKKAQ